MFIAILDFSTAEADRPAALAQLGAERFAVRAMPGCVDFRAFASPECTPTSPFCTSGTMRRRFAPTSNPRRSHDQASRCDR